MKEPTKNEEAPEPLITTESFDQNSTKSNINQNAAKSSPTGNSDTCSSEEGTSSEFDFDTADPGQQNNCGNSHADTQQGKNSTTFSALLTADLKRSGLSPDDFPLPVIETDNGYKIQYPDPVNGGCMKDLRGRDYCRERLLVPVRDKDGKLIKYLTLTGSGNRIFIIPDVHRYLIENPTADILVTEGEKKVIKGVKSGINCIGLGGIWNWLESKEKRQGKDGQYKIHQDLLPYLTRGRNVIFIFDSDATDKEKALDFDYCAFRFAESLGKLGCKLYRVNIPDGGGTP